METQEEEDDFTEPASTNPEKPSTDLTILARNKRDLSPEGSYERETSKKVTFASDVTNDFLLTETAYDEDNAHMSDARTGNYTEGGFPGMQ